MNIKIKESVKPSLRFSDVEVGQVCVMRCDAHEVLKINDDTCFNLVVKRELAMSPSRHVSDIFNLEGVELVRV